MKLGTPGVDVALSPHPSTGSPLSATAAPVPAGSTVAGFLPEDIDRGDVRQRVEVRA